MKSMLLIIGVLISATGMYPYIKAMIRGSVRPELVTWSIWTLLSGVLTLSAFLHGNVASGALSAEAFVSCAIVVILGARQGTFHIGKLDMFCLTGAAIGITSLVLFRSPALSLLLSVAVDAVAFIPTFIHGWRSPDEESIVCYFCAVVGASLSLVVALMNHGGIVGAIYPVYAVLFNGAMAMLLLAGQFLPDTGYGYDGEEV